jgi:hypothetical protein
LLASGPPFSELWWKTESGQIFFILKTVFLNKQQKPSHVKQTVKVRTMSLVRILKTVGILDCCNCGQGESSIARQRCHIPVGEVPSARTTSSKQQMAASVGINFQEDKSGALVVWSLIPEGNDCTIEDENR